MSRHILYLENDFLWVQSVKPHLERYGRVTTVDSEHDFRAVIDTIVRTGEWPSVVVLEQIVRWARPAPEMPELPPEVRREGSARAGIRCYNYLRRMQNGAGRTPVIFYSIVDPKTISEVLQGRGIEADPTDYQCIEKADTFTGLHAALELVF